MTLATRLKALRAKAGITQVELAVRAGVALSVLTRIEGGKHEAPNWVTICRLADALNVPTDAFRSCPEGSHAPIDP